MQAIIKTSKPSVSVIPSVYAFFVNRIYFITPIPTQRTKTHTTNNTNLVLVLNKKHH